MEPSRSPQETAGSGLRGTGEAGRVQEKGAAPTALTGIYWGFCGNVYLGRKKNPLPWKPNIFPAKLSVSWNNLGDAGGR